MDGAVPSYDPNERFAGQINAVRVYNDLRTPAEVDACNDRADNTGEANLSADWRVDNEDSSTVFNVAGGPGTSLAFENVTGPGFTPTTATAVLGVAEDAAAGTVAAFLSNSDPDTVDSHTYSIISDTSNSFDIVGNELRIAATSSLDFGTATSHQVVVEVEDAGGLTYQETIEISVTKGNGTPTGLEVNGVAARNGIAINMDGGNGTYYEGSAPADIDTFTQLTIESQVAISGFAGQEVPLISYRDASVDQLELGIVVDDAISTDPYFIFEVAGQQLNITSVDAAQWMDGQHHTFSMTWDSTTGDWGLFVDGAVVANGTGHAIGASIAAGGVLVVGQEQDSPGGSFSTGQTFEGVYSDLRLFRDVRTPAEITANANQLIPNGEPNLAANWVFGTDDNVATVVDSVSGNDLTLQQSTEPGFTPSVPLRVVTIAEDASTGDDIAMLLGIDPDVGETFPYSLLDNASGRFAINGNILERTATNAISFEVDPPIYAITVQVMDSDGATYDQNLHIYVSDVAENLTFSSATIFTDDGVAETSITGSNDADTFTGNFGDDNIDARFGDDVIYGRSGNDTLIGEAGNDQLFGGTGDDSLYGEADDD